jgi:Zn-finger nucleic acid-binding protein
MNCIRCQSRMKKTARDNLLIDMCPDCGGVWLDGGELEMMESGTGQSVDHLIQQARKEMLQDSSRLVHLLGLCPKCEGAHLQPVKKRGIELDLCPKCKGMFFDEKELDLVLKGRKETWFASILDLIRS